MRTILRFWGATVALGVCLSGCARSSQPPAASCDSDCDAPTSGDGLIALQPFVGLDGPIAEPPDDCPSGDVAFAIERIEIAGTLTQQGGEVQPPYGLTRVEFVPRGEGTPARGTLGPDGSYRVVISPGRYEVRWGLGSGSLSLLRDVVLDVSQVLDLQARTARVSGTVTLDGSEPPVSQSGRGQVHFEGTDAGAPRFSTALEPEGEAGFGIVLPAGLRYDVSWSHTGRVVAGPQPEAPAAMPFGDFDFGRLEVDGPSEHAFDIDRSHREVHGEVTYDGGPLPGPEDSQPAVGLLLVDGSLVTVELARGYNRYAFRILQGDHLLQLQQVGEPIGDLPRGWSAITLCEACALGDGDEQIELLGAKPPTVAVGGVLRFVGSWPPQGADGAEQPTATLTFHDTAAAEGRLPPVEIEVDSSGSFAGELPERVYRVTLTPGRLDSGGSSGVDGGGEIARELTIDGPRTDLRLEAQVVHLRGELTVNGRSMPDSAGEDARAGLWLEPMGLLGRRGIAVPDAGPVVIDLHLIAGDYVLQVFTHEWLGRTHLRTYDQDVLPPGDAFFGPIRVRPELEAERQRLDLSVARLAGTIEHFGLPPDVAVDRGHVLRFAGDGGNVFWTPAPSVEGEFEILLYAGHYTVDVGYVEQLHQMNPHPSEAPSPLLNDAETLEHRIHLGDVCMPTP